MVLIKIDSAPMSIRAFVDDDALFLVGDAENFRVDGLKLFHPDPTFSKVERLPVATRVPALIHSECYGEKGREMKTSFKSNKSQ